MKHLFTKWLAALLAAMLLLSPVALMEELEPAAVEPTEAVEVADEAVEEEIAVADVDAVETEEAIDFGEDEEEIVEFPGEIEFTSNDEMALSLSESLIYEAEPAPLQVQKVVAIDATNFPDPAFRNFLLQNRDFDGDGWFTNLDIEWTREISLGTGGGCDDNTPWKPGIGATSLKGIELFPNLEYLDCSNNQLTSLDLSNNTKLIQLRCEDNPLTVLDISHCSNELLAHITPAYYQLVDNNTHVKYVERIKDCGADFDFVYLCCNSNVQIIGGNPVPPYVAPAAAAPAPAPAPVINATKKSNKTTITVAPGTVCQLNVGTTTKPAKKFKSSNKKVATVDKNGNVKIKKAGKVKITFKVGKKTRTVVLNIKDPTIPKNVTLAASSTEVKKGDTVTLTPTIPEGTKSTFKWKSSNKRVATVKNGVVTFKKKGKVTITCTAKRGKKKAKMTFNVSPQ